MGIEGWRLAGTGRLMAGTARGIGTGTGDVVVTWTEVGTGAMVWTEVETWTGAAEVDWALTGAEVWVGAETGLMDWTRVEALTGSGEVA